MPDNQEERIKRVLGAVLGIPPGNIPPEASMDTVSSWDSLRHMNLILALEEEFHISIPDEEAANLSSLPLLRLTVSEQLKEV
jgi:acyl carrier protein